MNVVKPFFVLLFIFPTILPAREAAVRNSSSRAVEVRKIYVGSFGASLDAVYLRHKLVLRLARSRRLIVVDDPATADAILSGTAQLRLVGYYNSNSRIRYRNSASVPVYDARMMVRLEDRGGHSLWSGNLKPRFWGSQYVSDNVVNQTARHVAEVLR